MEPIITEQTLQVLKSGLTGMGELAKAGSTTLVDEVVKLYIFFGIVGILKAAAVFIVMGVVWKFLNVLEKSDSEGKNTTMTKSLKTATLIISIVYFTSQSIPHVLSIGKAVVAPNLFLVEKGLELVGKKAVLEPSKGK